MTAVLKRERRSARDCHPNIVPQVGGEESGEAVQQTIGTGMRSFAFVLSTRAAIRALTDASPTATVLSVDIGAYDHVFRGAMLSKSALSPPVRQGHVFGAISLHVAG